ncbi:LysR family transcriptional regulator [Lactobacillus sp. ESL0791]|uniref:LysR family transcriptional regulator n=1 Tax=Lactobacillus sp. ESL0791 TaxID=2983234 RepID=UPI0023F679E2|nr:LysR family transcriptional regulator [Lactobacillus sp. ESL0791]MDF7639411.1 LysR family transcriptional regulator [Lactobacillus sp. ESL0791]
MEFRVLRYFLTIANERNISRAAAKLHVSQPTISRQIHELEQELGVTLFTRSTRTIKLTADGEYLANQARQLLTLADKTVDNIGKTSEISGSVFIGCSEAPMISSIAAAIKQLNAVAPKVTVNLYSCDATEVKYKIQNGVFDFGFVLEPFDKVDYNFLMLPGATRWGILTRRDSALAQKTTIKVNDLIGQPVIMPQRHNSRNLLTDWFGSNNFSFHIVATYNLLNNAAVLAKCGVGHVLCLDKIVNTQNTDLKFIPLEPSLIIHSTLIWPTTALLSQAAKAFLHQLKKLLPPDKQTL